MLGPAPIQFSAVSIGQPKFRLAVGIAETLPQRYRERGPITGRQLEQVRKRTRRHDSILAWLGTQPQLARRPSAQPNREAADAQSDQRRSIANAIHSAISAAATAQAMPIMSFLIIFFAYRQADSFDTSSSPRRSRAGLTIRYQFSDLTELRLSCERQARGRKGLGSSQRMTIAGDQPQRFTLRARQPSSAG
jgi:hypothetical protein